MVKVSTWKKKNIMRTYVAIVLDKSGSMCHLTQETITGFNKQIETIKESAKGEVLVSFVTFNHDVDVIYFNEPVESLKPITSKDYKPNGYTAMYDAVEYTIKRLQAETNDTGDTAFLLLIMSDGMENASKKANRNDLAELIQSVQDTQKWTITYMGANQDLSKISKDLHIPVGNTSNFAATGMGMSAAMYTMGSANPGYFARRSSGVSGQSTTSFYAPEEPKEEEPEEVTP